MDLEFSKQVPLRASPAISQVAKRGSANLTLHNLLSIPHGKLERHQVGIIPNGLSSRQRHAARVSASIALLDRGWGKPKESKELAFSGEVRVSFAGCSTTRAKTNDRHRGEYPVVPVLTLSLILFCRLNIGDPFRRFMSHFKVPLGWAAVCPPPRPPWVARQTVGLARPRAPRKSWLP